MTLVVSKGITLDNGTSAAAIAGVTPTLDYRFARDRREIETISLTDKLTFSGGNQGTFVGSDGFIQGATTNVPRFDHDPLSGRSLGLLVEEPRTNVAWPSADYSGANWSKTNIQVSASTTTAPDGSTCFAYEGSSASSLLKRLRFNFITTTVGAYTWSIYLKAGTENSCAITLQDNTGTNGGVADILLTNGTVTVPANNFGANTNTTVSVQALSNGFYRVSLTSTFVAALSQIQAIITWDANGPSVTTGTLFPWGAQLEAGATPTSYIPTTTGTVLRPADSAVINGTGVLTGTRTLVAKPEGCAIESGTNIILQPGFRAERVMVFPTALNPGQIAAVRSAM